VINTIQVAAYSKRREVAVMKLVGASNWFIQAPFVLEAVAAGLIGAIIAYGTLVLAKIYIFDGELQALTSVLTPVPWLNVNLMLPNPGPRRRAGVRRWTAGSRCASTSRSDLSRTIMDVGPWMDLHPRPFLHDPGGFR
jgi:hypothetical protein